MSDFIRPMGVLQAESKTRVERAAKHITHHSVGNNISGCEFAVEWEKECRDAFDVRRGHYEESTGRQVAHIDNAGTFLCTLPPSVIDGMNTDEIEDAVERALKPLIREHISDYHTFDSIDFDSVDSEGYTTIHWMVDGVQVQFTVYAQATLVK